MAASKSILDALVTFDEVLLEAKLTTEIFTDLAGDQPDAPSWPFVVERHMHRIEQAAENLQTLVRQQALPLLTDVEAASRSL